MAKVIYLTGASGFLGGYVTKELQKDDDVSKIYCPIRSKKGLPGIERMKKDLPYDKCAHLELDDPLPKDVTHIILNAYSTRFDEPILKKLQDNVVPIVRILDECRARQSSIQGIVLVSTAYVQPPLPYRRKEKNRLPFLLDSMVKISPTKLYQSILEHDNVLELVPDLPQYYRQNSYVFSKHLLEHMMAETYGSLPICIVRPSMIAPPTTLDYGLNTKSAVPLMMALGPYPVLLAPVARGKANVVFIEDVTRDILDGIYQTATSAVKDKDTNWPWHPIVSSTGKSDVEILKLFQVGAPWIPRFDIQREWLRNMVRQFEFFMALVVLGRKASNLLKVVYENYDYFTMHTWDYEVRYEDDLVALLLEHKNTYFEKFLHKGDVHRNWGVNVGWAAFVFVLAIGFVLKQQGVDLIFA